MSHRLCCYTLFNIEQTGVLNRSRPQDPNVDNWLQKRNTQCNFDTILQVISLRSQPEVIKSPTKIEMTPEHFEMFGFVFQHDSENPQFCWKFEFEVHHESVFAKDDNTLGALYNDCEGVPMIECDGQLKLGTNFLNTSVELKNIHFEVV